MIPFGLTEKQFISRYQRELDQVVPTLIAALRELFLRTVDEDVKSANVEIFLDEYGAAPAIWIYFHGRNNRVDHMDQSLFAGRSLELPLPLSALAEFDEQYFVSLGDGEAEFSGLAIAGNTVKQWFAECWWKAGGWLYHLPVTLAVHDGIGDGEVIQLTEVTQ